MTPYLFQSQDFALSETGVHLLRNKFNFKTIPYEEVTRANLRRDVEIKRPLVVLCLGLVMLLFALKQCALLYGWIIGPHLYRMPIEFIVVPIIPGLLGAYCLYIAIRRGPVFRLDDGKTSYKLRLREVYKSNRVAEFRTCLDKQLGARLPIEDSIGIE